MSIRHTFTLRRPSSGQDTGEIENEEGEYYKTGRPDTYTSTDSLAVLSHNSEPITHFDDIDSDRMPRHADHAKCPEQSVHHLRTRLSATSASGHIQIR